MRGKGSLSGFLRRKRAQIGAPKAITATAHKLARIIYHMVKHGEAYVQETAAKQAAEDLARKERQFLKRAKELGFEVKKVDPPPAPPADAGEAQAPPATA